jgi:head-tail adaptor
MPNITPADRLIVDRDRVLGIEAVLDREDRKRELMLQCKEQLPPP